MARPSSAKRVLIGLIFAGILFPAQAVVPTIIQPSWSELPVAQKQILAPLAEDWDQLEDWRRKKWLDIAHRYPTMGATEQARVQQRMRDWAKLTPDERKAARELFRNVQKATPEQREALKQMWAEYQALSEDERRRIKDQTAARTATQPGGSVPRPSAAK